MGRGKAWSGARQAVLESAIAAGKRPCDVLRQHPDWDRGTLYRCWKRLQEGQPLRQPGSGSKRTWTVAQLEALQTEVETNPQQTSTQLAKKVGLKSSSVARYLLKEHLQFRGLKQQKAQVLTAKQKEARLKWCKKMKARIIMHTHGLRRLSSKSKTALDPRKIFFSDEKYFRAGNEPGVVWAPRAKRKKDLPASLVHAPVKKQGPASVMVSAGISYKGITQPYFCKSGCKVDSKAYIDILSDHLLPAAISQFEGAKPWYFMQDGAPSHTSKLTREHLDSYKDEFEVLDWPAASPDLNPCDFYLWSRWQQHLKDHMPAEAANTMKEAALRAAILAAYRAFEDAEIKAAIDSFEKRLDACIAAGGGQFEGTL